MLNGVFKCCFISEDQITIFLCISIIRIGRNTDLFNKYKTAPENSDAVFFNLI